MTDDLDDYIAVSAREMLDQYDLGGIELDDFPEFEDE